MNPSKDSSKTVFVLKKNLPISGSGRVFHQAGDFSLVEVEANVVSRVFVQHHCPLKGPENTQKINLLRWTKIPNNNYFKNIEALN